MIRVVDVRGLRTPAERATVVYVGRFFAGWPASRYGNPFKPRPGFDAVKAYRSWFLGRPREMVEDALAELWEATGHGEKPLGCWCGSWQAGVSPAEPEFCHAIVLAKLLHERFGGTQ
jgi:hypothetical protein